jgi:glycosyltransferase involved in cell wall biosynthesis
VRKPREPLLLIGPYDAHGRFPGGAPISFRELVDFIRRRGVRYRVADVRRFSGPLHGPFNALWFAAALACSIPGAGAVMLNGSRRGLIYIGPVVYALARLFRAKFYVHPFGGDFDQIVDETPAWQRGVLQRTILRADVVFLQTRALMEHFDGLVARAAWFPNARSRLASVGARRTFNRRFVFVSSITVEKGAGVLLDAIARLDASYTVDFYGVVVDANVGERVARSGRYRGPVAREHIVDVLRAYDVLVLPTFTREEGLPGIVIEAFSVGMPAIATRWRAVPEIVEHGKSGLLVTPHSAEELAAAMASIDDESFARLSAGALAAFDTFDGDRVHAAILDILLE